MSKELASRFDGLVDVHQPAILGGNVEDVWLAAMICVTYNNMHADHLLVRQIRFVFVNLGAKAQAEIFAY